jgi:hypothetical protein
MRPQLADVLFNNRYSRIGESDDQPFEYREQFLLKYHEEQIQFGRTLLGDSQGDLPHYGKYDRLPGLRPYLKLIDRGDPLPPLPPESPYLVQNPRPNSGLVAMAFQTFDTTTGRVGPLLVNRTVDPKMQLDVAGPMFVADATADTFWLFGGRDADGGKYNTLWRGELSSMIGDGEVRIGSSAERTGSSADPGEVVRFLRKRPIRRRCRASRDGGNRPILRATLCRRRRASPSPVGVGWSTSSAARRIREPVARCTAGTCAAVSSGCSTRRHRSREPGRRWSSATSAPRSTSSAARVQRDGTTTSGSST